MLVLTGVAWPLATYVVAAMSTNLLLPFMEEKVERLVGFPPAMLNANKLIELELAIARSFSFAVLLVYMLMDANYRTPDVVVATWATVVLAHEFGVYALTTRHPMWAKTAFFLVELTFAFLHRTDTPLKFVAICALGDMIRFPDITAHYMQLWFPGSRRVTFTWLHYAEMLATAALFESSIWNRNMDAVCLVLCVYLFNMHVLHVSLHARVPRVVTAHVVVDPFAMAQLGDLVAPPLLAAEAAPESKETESAAASSEPPPLAEGPNTDPRLPELSEPI